MRITEISASVIIPSDMQVLDGELSEHARINSLTLRASLGREDDPVKAALELRRKLAAAVTELLDRVD